MLEGAQQTELTLLSPKREVLRKFLLFVFMTRPVV